MDDGIRVTRLPGVSVKYGRLSLKLIVKDPKLWPFRITPQETAFRLSRVPNFMPAPFNQIKFFKSHNVSLVKIFIALSMSSWVTPVILSVWMKLFTCPRSISASSSKITYS